MTLSVEPKFHPKIIGRKGAVISQIRKDYDVNVQFPDKGDEQQVCVNKECILKAAFPHSLTQTGSSLVVLEFFSFFCNHTFHTCHSVSVSLPVSLSSRIFVSLLGCNRDLGL